jgi:hypothetical protein
MAITRTPIIDDDGTGTTGTVIDNAWKTELYNQIDGLAGGTWAWATVPFNAANFWPGVTAGHVTLNCYAVTGKTLFWILQLQNAPAPSPAAGLLYCTMPTGALFNGNAVLGGLATCSDNGVYTNAFAQAGTNTAIAISKAVGGNWTGPVYAYMTLTIGLA